MPNSVYLDYNATAPIRPDVIQTMAEVMADVGNPSSVHAAGRRARKLVNKAREQVAALVSAPPEAVIFTSGGTEANNQALADGPIMASMTEHPSVLALIGDHPSVPVDSDGIIAPNTLANLLEGHRPATLAVMLANNETGVVQPVKEVAAVTREAGVRLHVDAVQAAGKIPVDFPDLGADTLSLSAHKLGGPQGVGALICRDGAEPLPLLQGGAQERRYRAGTENVAGIVGFGAAAALAKADQTFAARIGALRDRLEAGVLGLAPDARIIGAKAPRLPNTTCLALQGIGHETQLIHFDLAGIAVSAGSACSSGKVAVSPVLTAMGLPDAVAASAIRISLGWNSQASDVGRFLEACSDLLKRRRLKQSA